MTQDEYCNDCTSNFTTYVWDACAELNAEENTCLGLTGNYRSADWSEAFVYDYDTYCDLFDGCCLDHYY